MGPEGTVRIARFRTGWSGSEVDHGRALIIRLWNALRVAGRRLSCGTAEAVTSRVARCAGERLATDSLCESRRCAYRLSVGWGRAARAGVSLGRTVHR